MGVGLPKSQSNLRQNGHAYDVIKFKDPESRQERTLYFNVAVSPNYASLFSLLTNAASERRLRPTRKPRVGIKMEISTDSKEGNMKSSIPRYVIAIGIFAVLPMALARGQQNNQGDQGNNTFRVASTTFSDGGTLPLIMVWNQCSFYTGGGNQSPELSWTHAPDGSAESRASGLT